MQLLLKPMRISVITLIRIRVNPKGTQRGNAMTKVISHQQSATKGKDNSPVNLLNTGLCCCAVKYQPRAESPEA